MSSAPQRRPLAFQNLDDVVADVERLNRDGYTKAGNWDLAQMCGHLTEWLTFPVNGYPRKARIMMWVLRNMFGRRLGRKWLRERKMAARGMTIPETVPKPGGNADEAVRKLKQAVERFKAHADEYDPSPLLGRLTRDEALQLQLIHCAHHLSFLVPLSR